MMKMINHKNIVKLKEVLASNSKIYLVLELIKGGDLFDLIKGNFYIANYLYLSTYLKVSNYLYSYIVIEKNGLDEKTARKYFL